MALGTFFAVNRGSLNSVGKKATSAKGGTSRILASPTQGNLLSRTTRLQPRARPWAPAAVSRGTALYAGCWVGTRVRGARRLLGPSVTGVNIDFDREWLTSPVRTKRCCRRCWGSCSRAWRRKSRVLPPWSAPRRSSYIWRKRMKIFTSKIPFDVLSKQISWSRKGQNAVG